jgi:uncharacterized membrane protein
MRDRQLRRAVSDAGKIVFLFAAKINSVPHRKMLFGALAALLVVVAVPLLFRADTQLAAANSTLKCYDSAGEYEPCGTRAGASASRLNGRTIGAHLSAGWIATALYRPESWKTAAVDQPENSATSAPAAPRSGTSRKHLASACGRRLLPCFFSALRRGVTHFASAAAAQARPAREHL